jgi:hypothetical protein
MEGMVADQRKMLLAVACGRTQGSCCLGDVLKIANGHAAGPGTLP